MTENRPTDTISRRRALQVGAFTVGTVATALPATAMGDGVRTQTEDVFGQGVDGDVVSPDGATLRRTRNGVSMTLSMPTPEPGTYEYPKSGVYAGPGDHEAFTLWAFVFNDPPTEDWDGAFFVTGHVVSGPELTLSGHISTNTDPFVGDTLDNPAGAEVHLAVAPHGALSAELLPDQIQTPTGPGPDIWWLALFAPPN